MGKRLVTIVLMGTLAGANAAGAADDSYEPGLVRLSEILGSLHFLGTLCDADGESWRAEMDRVIASEKPDPARLAKLDAGFDRGYRSFARNYVRCTPSASEAIRLYMKEGEAISRDIVARYAN